MFLVTYEKCLLFPPIQDPAPALKKALLHQERGLARHLLREARREVAQDPPQLDTKKDALARSRQKGLGFCGVKMANLFLFAFI